MTFRDAIEMGWPNRAGTCWLVHRAAFVRFAIRKLQGSGLFGLCDALLVRFSLSRHCLTAQEALTQLAYPSTHPRKFVFLSSPANPLHHPTSQSRAPPRSRAKPSGLPSARSSRSLEEMSCRETVFQKLSRPHASVPSADGSIRHLRCGGSHRHSVHPVRGFVPTLEVGSRS
jgi:hypothetical protein